MKSIIENDGKESTLAAMENYKASAKKAPLLKSDDIPTNLRELIDAAPIIHGKVPTTKEIEAQKVFKANVKDALEEQRRVSSDTGDGAAVISYNAIMKLVKAKNKKRAPDRNGKKESKAKAGSGSKRIYSTKVPRTLPVKVGMKNDQAEQLGIALQTAPTYLTLDGKSWIIHVKKWWPATSPEAFQAEWNLCPTERHEIHVWGKTVLEQRWSQSWGFSYKYSGSTNKARPIEESTMVPKLLNKINGIMMIVGTESEKDDEGCGKISNKSKPPVAPYNGCLQNWYTPEDRIGLHADDVRNMNQACPIWSLTWGGTRRFLLRPKRRGLNNTNVPPATTTTSSSSSSSDPVEVWLEDGDLLLMGGTCQETHKHEIPKVRGTKDPPTSNRVNWTIRAFCGG